MTIVSSIFIAILFSGGSYLLLRRSAFDLILGMALLSAGTNVLLVSVGGWDAASHPPFLSDLGKSVSSAVEEVRMLNYADPLPQALILTALVIGFGFLSFLMALVSRLEEDLEKPAGSSSSSGSDPS